MRLGTFLLVLGLACSGYAQLTLKSSPRQRLQSLPGTSIATIEQNRLPFWDDFSITPDGLPDALRIWGTDTTLQWDQELSSDVLVNSTLAINPPTFRVATLDGVNGLGQNHSNPDRLTDQLVTAGMDLSNFNEADDLFISFYWQCGGNVEKPESEDSIRLQFFIQEAGSWETIWSRDGGDAPTDSLFYQEMIRIEDRFISDNSQFRFQAFGDQDGPFDAWHLDYIYLNNNRSQDEAQNGYDDAAFSNPVSSFITPFSSMPVNQFIRRSEHIRNQQTSISYLNRLPPTAIGEDSVINIYIPEVTYSLELLNNQSIIVNDQRSAGQVLTNALSYINLDLGLSDPGIPPVLLADQDFSPLAQFDSVVLRSTAFFLDSIPTFLDDNIVDLTINDTIRNEYLLHDYYAYDDGTAEYAVGVNQRGDQVGVQYWVEEPDTLTQVDIYFPNIAPSSEGTSINLRIYKDLEDQFPLSSLPITIQTAAEINSFNSYELNNRVVVSDTFYITYEQNVNQYIGVGFDRSNTDASRYIFENIGDGWVRNEQIDGALMIRPVFKTIDEFTLGVNTEPIDPVIYPNPSQGMIRIRTDYQQIELRNLSGQLLRSEGKRNFHDFSEYTPGIYLLSIINSDRIITKKVLIE